MTPGGGRAVSDGGGGGGQSMKRRKITEDNRIAGGALFELIHNSEGATLLGTPFKRQRK